MVGLKRNSAALGLSFRSAARPALSPRLALRELAGSKQHCRPGGRRRFSRLDVRRRTELVARFPITLILATILTIVSLACPAAAGAHLRSGTVAVDYRANVFGRETSAYSAQIFQSDRALSLTIKTGHVVELLGYLGEPVFRLDAAGLSVNTASPTAVVLRLLKKSQRTTGSTPHWRLQPGRHSVVWQDARAQGLPPAASSGVWNVPLIVDGHRAHLEGELRRFAAPSPWPWLGALAAVLAAGLWPLAKHRRHLAGPTAIVFAIAASVAALVILVAFAADAYASPGTWIEAADAIAFLGGGVWVLLRGPQHWHVAAAIGLGLVGLAVGLLEGAIYLHPIVLAILPATVTRVTDIVAIGAGLNAAALGSLFYIETTGLMPNDKPHRAPPVPGDPPRQ
jgi:hypothetical protein